jgi:hypothetical protein
VVTVLTLESSGDGAFLVVDRPVSVTQDLLNGTWHGVGRDNGGATVQISHFYRGELPGEDEQMTNPTLKSPRGRQRAGNYIE